MSRITHNKFYTAYTYLSDMFGVEISEDLFETMAYVAWRKIGNRETRMYKAVLEPEPDDLYGWSVEIPCNASIIEAVTLEYEDYQKTSSREMYPGLKSLPAENYNEMKKYGVNDQYISGRLVKYRQLGDRLYFTESYGIVKVLYKGIHFDEDGLPFLNDKEVHAVALYCAYSQKYKEGIQTKDGATIQLAQLLKKDWEKACSQARVPEYINQNEMNEILNANSSWNRKMFGKSFKIMQ